MNHKDLLLLAVPLTFMISLVGCGRSPTEPIATPNPIPPTSKPTFPTGRFVHEQHKTCAFQFNKDGTWAYFYYSKVPEVEGIYSVDGNLYTEVSNTDSRCPFPASYTWTYDGQKLTFQIFGEDECGPRKSAYDGQIYIKSVFPTGRFTAKDGDWVLTFDDDGNFTFSEFGTAELSGTFSIQANELTWETDSYCDERGAGKSTYTWTFEGDILLFQVKGEDKCSERLSVLNNVPYQKEQ